MRKDGVIWTRVVEIERVTYLQGNTLMFQFDHRNRSGCRTLGDRIDKEHVPPFNGQTAWAEVERVSAKPWAFHRVICLVDPPKH